MNTRTDDYPLHALRRCSSLTKLKPGRRPGKAVKSKIENIDQADRK